jgi:hypothetical protein
MLQFDKSQATNSNAVWIETPNTSSNFYASLVAVYSQSYDNSNGTIALETVSAPNQYRNWLVIRNSGSLVPIPSGQYDVQIFIQSSGAEGRWGFTDDVWATTTEQWNRFGEGGPTGDVLYSDRAYISGSDETSITEYLSPNELGTYTTYNG